jgi:hypothetical protein
MKQAILTRRSSVLSLPLQLVFPALSIQTYDATLSITAICHYTKCPVLLIDTLNVIMLTVIMANTNMLIVIRVNVTMLSVVTLNVVEPF